jgi:hypothetical protein
MRELKLLDRTQPQTLYIGSLLLYLDAAIALFNVLFGGLSALTLLLGIVLPVAGAYGVANSRKLGYYVALVATGIPVLLILYYLATYGLGILGGLGLISVILTIVPFVLFVHPMSRSYVKAWFH